MPVRFLAFALLAALLAPPDAFERLRAEWAQDLHQKQIEACVALYSPDAVFVQPDGSRVEGASAIREPFKTVTSTFDSDLAFSSKRVEVSGDLAYDSGSYSETLVTRSNGKQMHSKGSYLTVYRKQNDGTLKIVEQVWNGTIESASQH
ncbi:MAG TPA: DUF4440 domain-containing protein [Terracidiphilus sp.]|nr:DUF4440 domain-containing protein [Terracidiphilus sp.]